jgi:hypothetical protein
MAMEVLLQSTTTDEYLAEPGSWTREIKHGRHFNDSIEAMVYCFRHNIRNVTVSLEFEKPEFNIRLDVSRAPTAEDVRN